MNTLENRRKISQILFIHDLFNGKIVSPTLLSELKIRVRENEFNIRVRKRNVNDQCILNERKNDIECPFTYMKKNFNQYYHLIDFNQSNDVVKKKLKRHFSELI